MDLGIKNKKAIVCASSQGLGLACATALAREGAIVYINGRDVTRLEAAKAKLSNTVASAQVHIVAADITTEKGREALVNGCPDADILINNNAGPQPGNLADWDHSAWMVALESNMLAPILLIRALIPGMRQRKFGRIVNITSAMVKSPRTHMGLSTSARTGLTAFSKAVGIDAVIDNVTINNLLPAEARRRIVETVAAKRFGTPEEFADACAFLCAAQSGFISGQNLQLDGGSYSGLI